MGRSATRPCTSQGNSPLLTSSFGTGEREAPLLTPSFRRGQGEARRKAEKQQPHENNLNQQNKTDQQEGNTLSHVFCIQALGD